MKAYKPPSFHHGAEIGEAVEIIDVGSGVPGLPAIDGSLLAGISSLPGDADVEVEAGADLAAAILANDAVYVSGDITIAAQIDVTNKKIIWKPGITVTLDAALGLDAGLYYDSSGLYESIVDGQLLMVAAHTGAFMESDNSGFLQAKGVYNFTAPDFRNAPVQSSRGFIDVIELTLPDNQVTVSGFSGGLLRINDIHLIGGGSSCRVNLNSCRIKTCRMTGTFRTFTSGLLASTYALQVNDGSIEDLTRGSTGTWGIYVNDSFVGAILSTSASDTYIGCQDDGKVGSVIGTNCRLSSPDATGRNNVLMAGTFENFDGNTSVATGGTFIGVGFSNTTQLNRIERARFIGGYSGGTVQIQTQADDVSFTAHEFENNPSLANGSDSIRFINCTFRSALTMVSGTEMQFTGCRFNANVTINAGAGCDFSMCEFDGSFTNNDQGNTRVSMCKNTSQETWMNNDQGIVKFKPTSTTDATKTQLFVDASSVRYAIASGETRQLQVRVTSTRDNGDVASFYSPFSIIKNVSGTTSMVGAVTGGGPDLSDGTGGTLLLDISADNVNDDLKLEITANAAENWTHAVTVEGS